MQAAAGPLERTQAPLNARDGAQQKARLTAGFFAAP